MYDILLHFNYIIQALVATIFTWSITALGAALVFIFKKSNKTILDSFLGLASGIMLAAIYFSLLSPAVELASNLNMIKWLTVFTGFILGGLFIFILNRFFIQIIKNENDNIKRITMLITSITLHNIPEGMAIGVAFGSLYYGIDNTTISAAWMLAVGIGIQNFPEGSAISLPLRAEGLTRKKAFFIGQLSGIVEPLAGVIGAILAIKMRILLPYLLSFAAGAMLYVVIIELIPESQSNEKKDLMAFFSIIGFSLMMILDIAFS